MRSMMIICELLFLSWLTVPVLAEDSDETKPAGISVRSLESCHVDFTEIGRRADFSGSVVYRSVVNAHGKILKLSPVTGQEFLSRFVKLEQLESCLMRWQFQDSGEYSIGFSAGTTGKTLEKWEINVTAQGKLLKVVLR